jgi:formate hydrogenlyase subunit 3/multisubunit Na+/H+ antiporter MnhD subunit
VSIADRLVLVVLVLDAVLLALLELLYLPLRLPPSYGGLPLPVTALLAGLTTPMLVSAAAQLVPRLSVAAAPLAAWLATVLVLGLTGPGGDALLQADFRSLLLMAAAVVPSGVVLGRLSAGRPRGKGGV